jgi:hypothetical protein
MAFTEGTVFDERGQGLRPRHRHLQVRAAPAHRAQKRQPLNVISTD